MSCPWPALEAFQEANATGNLSGAARLCSCIMSNGSVVSRSTPSTVDTAKSCGVSSASSFTKRKPVRYSERVVEKPTNWGRIRAVPQQGRCPIRKRKRADYVVIRQSPRFLFNASSRMQKSRKLIRAGSESIGTFFRREKRSRNRNFVPAQAWYGSAAIISIDFDESARARRRAWTAWTCSCSRSIAGTSAQPLSNLESTGSGGPSRCQSARKIPLGLTNCSTSNLDEISCSLFSSSHRARILLAGEDIIGKIHKSPILERSISNAAVGTLPLGLIIKPVEVFSFIMERFSRRLLPAWQIVAAGRYAVYDGGKILAHRGGQVCTKYQNTIGGRNELMFDRGVWSAGGLIFIYPLDHYLQTYRIFLLTLTAMEHHTEIIILINKTNIFGVSSCYRWINIDVTDCAVLEHVGVNPGCLNTADEHLNVGYYNLRYCVNKHNKNLFLSQTEVSNVKLMLLW